MYKAGHDPLYRERRGRETRALSVLWAEREMLSMQTASSDARRSEEAGVTGRGAAGEEEGGWAALCEERNKEKRSEEA